MGPEQSRVDFRIVEGETEETGFEIVEEERDVGLVPVDERWELVPVE